jgi:hypothetical protein
MNIVQHNRSWLRHRFFFKNGLLENRVFRSLFLYNRFYSKFYSRFYSNLFLYRLDYRFICK